MLTPAAEVTFIERLAQAFSRSPLQVNALQESDAEIVHFPGSPGSRLAVSIDTIEEEIRSGLYTDPYMIGWMIVMVNLSDLAAVGADPLGLVISETIPPGFTSESIDRLQRGIGDACRACGTYVFGGDTNEAAGLCMTGCAIGVLTGEGTLGRKGCHSGDRLYCSGPLGVGNAYAFARLTGHAEDLIPYRPQARLREGRLLRSFASACMDTSDGVMATLDQLMRVNGLGFHLDGGWEESLESKSRRLLDEAHLPRWLLLAGLHGEFELLFTVPRRSQPAFEDAAKTLGWAPRDIGYVTAVQQLTLPGTSGDVSIDTGLLRNLGATAATDFPGYVQSLCNYDRISREQTTIL